MTDTLAGDAGSKISETLAEIETRRLSGVLSIRQPTCRRSIAFDSGFITQILSDASKDDVIKIILRSSSAREQIKQLSSQAESLEETLPRILLQEGVIGEDELRKAEIKRVVEILDSILNDTQVKFEFQPDKVLTEPVMQLRVRPRDVLHKLQSREKIWMAIRKALPDYETVYELTERGRDTSLIGLFIPSQRIVYRFVDGVRSVRQMLFDCPISDFETLKVLAFFRSKQLMEPVKDTRDTAKTLPSKAPVSAANPLQDIESAETLYRRGDLVKAVEALECVEEKFPNNDKVMRLLREWRDELSSSIQSLIVTETIMPKLRQNWKEARNAQLSTQEAFILSRIDGSTRLKYLQTMTGINQNRFKRAIYRLYAMNLIELEAPKAQRISFIRETGRDEPERAEVKFEWSYDDLRKLYDKYTSMTYYEILDISPNATLENLRENFAVLSKRYHPDMYQGGQDIDPSCVSLMEQLFQIVHTAFRTLANPESRRQYDHIQQRTRDMLMDQVFAATPRADVGTQRYAGRYENDVRRPTPTKEEPFRKDKAEEKPSVKSRPKAKAGPQSQKPAGDDGKAGGGAPSVAGREQSQRTDSTDPLGTRAKAADDDSGDNGTKEERSARRFEKGMEAYRKKRYQEAEEAIISALKMDSHNKEYYHQLALVQLDWAKNLNDAELNVKRALTLDRENPDYYLTLARVYRKKNDHVMAERYYKSSLAWGIDDSSVVEKELKGMREEQEVGFLKKFFKKGKK
ncbi:DnaJ domain-containing protein [bacterium]|nr:DnaJ domain-containing protein [candidate division CSSED10-310 bacterium]